MTSVADHIKQLFNGFKLPLNDAALSEIAHYGADIEAEYDKNDVAMNNKITYAILMFAPILMLSPASYSVQENGFSKSVSFNAAGFLKWFSLMCKRYGIKDELSDKPKITFL